ACDFTSASAKHWRLHRRKFCPSRMIRVAGILCSVAGAPPRALRPAHQANTVYAIEAKSFRVAQAWSHPVIQAFHA
ncbi:MAG: hypothetical protein AAFZ05_13310, partial [Pseudomonadota bacterium]